MSSPAVGLGVAWGGAVPRRLMLDDVAVLEHDANLSVAYLCALAAKIGVSARGYWSRAFLGMSRVRVTPFFGLRLEQAAPQKAPPPITSFGSDQ